MGRPAKGTKEYREWRRRLRQAGPRFLNLSNEQMKRVIAHEIELRAERDEYEIDRKPSTYRLKKRRA